MSLQSSLSSSLSSSLKVKLIINYFNINYLKLRFFNFFLFGVSGGLGYGRVSYFYRVNFVFQVGGGRVG